MPDVPAPARVASATTGPAIVYVLGMHRSGTSAVSRLLGHLGFSHGDEDRLLPAAEDNPHGFWENTQVKGLNDRILARLGGNWQDVPDFPAGWHRDRRVADLRIEAVQALDELRDWAGDQDVVLKDPRLSLTLPFWLDLAPTRGVVLVMRRPTEVAGSLAARNGTPPNAAVSLWLQYTSAALASERCDVAVFAEDLAADPEGVTRGLAEALGVPSADDRAAAASAIDPDALHQHRVVLDDVPGAGTADLLYEVVRSRGLGPQAVDLARSLVGGPRQELIGRLDTRVAQLEAQLTSLRDEHRTEIERHEFEAARRARRELELRQATASLAELEGYRELVSEREKHIDALNRALAQLRRRPAKAEGAEQRDQIEKLQRDVDAWRQRAEKSRRDFDRLRNRRSVRATLGVARSARPLFRGWRRLRAGDRPTAIEPAAPASTPVPRPSPIDLAPDTASDTFPARRLPAGDAMATAIERLEQAPGVTVLVPVHNALEHTMACLQAVRRHLPDDADILVIDDASTDEDVLPTLQRWAAGDARVTVTANHENLGFTRTVNRGLQESPGRDVVLLNSDTVVPSLWLHRLRTAAYLFDDVATVTPLSDNAGAFSAPVVGEANDLGGPEGCEQVSMALRGRGEIEFPTTPTGNGFCMYIRRAALDDCGLLDADRFPRGYGEENDLCLRMRQQGWTHLVEPTVVVHHVKSVSFGEERQELATAGRAALDAHHPEYTGLVRQWVPSTAMERARANVALEAATRQPTRPRMLYVVHAGSGGTPATTEDLANGMATWYDSLVLTSDTGHLRLYELVDGRLRTLEKHSLSEPIRFGQTSRADYLAIVAQILVRFGIERVHARHLVKHTFDAVRAARATALPTVLSLHDFYYVCPTIHLMDEKGRFCGGVCTSGDGDCPIGMSWIADDAPKLKHSGVHWWRERTGPLLEQVDAIVTTSRSARDTYLNAFPQLAGRITIIEHGRDVKRRSDLVTHPSAGGRIRLLFPGNIDAHKGADVIRELRQLDTDGRLEIHFAGNVRSLYNDVPHVNHGPYEREGFTDLVAQVRPTFIGVLSTCSETYCHTLTEAWGAGVPVIGTDMGAVGERLRRHGGGFIVPTDDPAAALARIIEVAENPTEYRRLEQEARQVRIRPIAEMAADYRDLYRRLEGEAPAPRSPDALHLDVFVRRTPAPYPASVYVRTIARATSRPSASLDVRVQDPGPYISSALGEHGDAALVQRDAIEPDLLPQLLRTFSYLELPFVFDIDDNLLDSSLHPDGYWDQRRSDMMRDLLGAADLVTVSTPALADLVSRVTPRVRLERNHLHDDWWQLDEPAPDRPDPEAPTICIGYAGTMTHGRDLDLLEGALALLPTHVRERVEVEVVGGEREARPWYTRVAVPPERTPYPEFAPWLRSQSRRWHLAVAPLHDTGLNTWKSDLKVLEYAALGLPMVIADATPYQDVPDDVALRSPAEPSQWAERIEELVRDTDRRAQLATRAAAWVRAERRLSTHVGDWESAIRALTGQPSSVSA